MTKIAKKDLQELIANRLDITKKDAGTFLSGFQQEIEAQILAGNDIQFAELFIIKQATHKATVRRNPKTGEAINIPEKKTVKCKISPTIIKKIS